MFERTQSGAGRDGPFLKAEFEMYWAPEPLLLASTGLLFVRAETLRKVDWSSGSFLPNQREYYGADHRHEQKEGV